MIRPGREPLEGHIEADETFVGARKSGPPGRAAAGKSLVAGAVEIHSAQGRHSPLGRLRLKLIATASTANLENFLDADTARPLTVTTDGWRGYSGLKAKGHTHNIIKLSARTGHASQYLPAIHLVFGLAKRWLLGTHHGAVRAKHLQHYLDEYVFRFNRRTAKAISHGFARLIQYAIKTPPVTYKQIVHGNAT
jgi:transposase-like protein